MTQEQQIKIKSAVAIYRGLPDIERNHSLTKIRFEADRHPDGNIRTVAGMLLPHIERAELEIRQERAAMEARIKADIMRQVRAELPARSYTYDTEYDQRKAWEMRRGLLAFVGVGIVVAIVGSAVVWVVTSGVMPYLIGGGLLAFFIGFMLSSGSGRQDGAATPGTAHTTNTQTIVFNVSNTGNVSYEQTTQAQK